MHLPEQHAAEHYSSTACAFNDHGRAAAELIAPCIDGSILRLLRRIEPKRKSSRKIIPAGGYLIATALGGEAIPPRKWSGTDTSINS